MRRNVVLSVFCLFICLLVSCSLIEPSEKKGIFALGLNFELPQNAVAESRGLSRDGEDYNEHEHEHSITYTASVSVAWDGGGAGSEGSLTKTMGQKSASGNIVVLGIPYGKTLTVNLKIKDSDGDVLYNGTTTTTLQSSIPITIDLKYSENLDLDCDIDIKYNAPLSSDIKLVAEYNNADVSDEPVSLLSITEGAEITFTCLDSDGKPLSEEEVYYYSWYLNGTQISGTTSSVSINPYTQKLIDLSKKNYVECVVSYREDSKKLSCVKEFSFDFTDSFELINVIYPVGDCLSGASYSLNQYNPVFKLDENIIESVRKFAVNPNSNDIYAVTEDSVLHKIKYSSEESNSEYELTGLEDIYAMTVGFDGKIWIAAGENVEVSYIHAYYDFQTELREYYKLESPADVGPASITAIAAEKLGNDDYLVVAYKPLVNDGSYVQVYKVIEDPDDSDSKILTTVGESVNVSDICDGCHTVNDMAFIDVGSSPKLCVLLNGSSLNTTAKTIYCRGAVALGEINANPDSGESGISFETAVYGLIDPESSNAKWSYKAPDDYTAYFPCGEQESSCFFAATKIIGINGDSVYIADDGACQEEDDLGMKCGTNKDRIMEFNPQTNTVSVYAEDLFMSYPETGLFGSGNNIGE